MGKSGWFVFLVAVVVVIGLGIYFFGPDREGSAINLDKEYELNGSVVLSGTFVGESFVDHVEEFSEINERGKLEGKKTYFVFVDSSGELKLAEFEEISQGELALTFGDSNQFYGIKNDQYREQKIENFEIIVNGKTYDFDLKPEENAYFVIQEG